MALIGISFYTLPASKAFLYLLSKCCHKLCSFSKTVESQHLRHVNFLLTSMKDHLSFYAELNTLGSLSVLVVFSLM